MEIKMITKIKESKNLKINKMNRIINSLYMMRKIIKINKTIKMRFQMYQIHQKVNKKKITNNKKRNNDQVIF